RGGMAANRHTPPSLLARHLRHDSGLARRLGLVRIGLGGLAALRPCRRGIGGDRLARLAGLRLPGVAGGDLGLRLDRRGLRHGVEEKALRAVLLRLDRDAHDAALPELAEQDLVGEPLLDVLLDDAREWTRAHLLVVALLRQPG